MKRLFILGLLVAGAATFTACKKDYTCTCSAGGVSSSTEYTGLSKSQASAQESLCTLAGCTWASN